MAQFLSYRIAQKLTRHENPNQSCNIQNIQKRRGSQPLRMKKKMKEPKSDAVSDHRAKQTVHQIMLNTETLSS